MKNKRFIFIVALVCILNIIAVCFCAYLFLMLQKESGKILNTKKQIDFYEKQIASKSDVKGGSEEFFIYREKIDKIFLSEENIVVLIEILEQLSTQTGVALNLGGISMGSEKNEDVPVIKLSVSGNFVQVYHYLELVENIPYYLSFEKFHFEKESNGLWRSSLEITVNSFKKL